MMGDADVSLYRVAKPEGSMGIVDYIYNNRVKGRPPIVLALECQEDLASESRDRLVFGADEGACEARIRLCHRRRWLGGVCARE